MMCASEQEPTPGGGPLKGIIDDPNRSKGERELCIALVRFLKQRQAMHTKRMELLPGVNISFAQVRQLFHLPATGPIKVTQYAESADMTPASATQALGTLEDLQLVSRTRSTKDKRVVFVELTDRGHMLLSELRTQFVVRWDSTTNEISEDDLSTAARVLGSVLTVFKPE